MDEEEKGSIQVDEGEEVEEVEGDDDVTKQSSEDEDEDPIARVQEIVRRLIGREHLLTKEELNLELDSNEEFVDEQQSDELSL